LASPIRSNLSTMSSETRNSYFSVLPISSRPSSKGTVNQCRPRYARRILNGCITYSLGTPSGWDDSSSSRSPVNPPHPWASLYASESRYSASDDARVASKSGVNLLQASPTRSFIAVPPLTTPGGSIWPTTVFAIARWMRRSGRSMSRETLLIRSPSERRLVGGSRRSLTQRLPVRQSPGQHRICEGARAGLPRARPREGAPSLPSLRNPAARAELSPTGCPRRP